MSTLTDIKRTLEIEREKAFFNWPAFKTSYNATELTGLKKGIDQAISGFRSALRTQRSSNSFASSQYDQISSGFERKVSAFNAAISPGLGKQEVTLTSLRQAVFNLWNEIITGVDRLNFLGSINSGIVGALQSAVNGLKSAASFVGKAALAALSALNPLNFIPGWMLALTAVGATWYFVWYRPKKGKNVS